MAFSIEEQRRYYAIFNECLCDVGTQAFYRVLCGFHRRTCVGNCVLFLFVLFLFLHNFFLSLSLPLSLVRSFINNKCVYLKNIVLTK